MSGETSIPFNRPSLVGNELRYMEQALTHGHQSANGPFSRKVTHLLREALGAEDVLLTTSCTDALEMSALLLDLSSEDTVIVPSFTFVSTALAFARTGARIRFVDIEPHTLGIDPQLVADLLDSSVKAVVAVHYAGIGCDVDGLRHVLADWPDVTLIEDNAHGLFGTYRNTPLGSFGRFSTLSFHETKNISCGEGGALVLNESGDVERAHVLYDKGTDRRAFMLGQVDQYTWQDVGSSFGLSDVLAAVLLGQLEGREVMMRRRREIHDAYLAALSPQAEELGYELPVIPPDRTSAYHLFHVLLPDRTARDHVLNTLRASGIGATFHYVPLHDSPGGARFTSMGTPCPVTNDISGRLVRLPYYASLSDRDVERIADAFIASLH